MTSKQIRFVCVAAMFVVAVAIHFGFIEPVHGALPLMALMALPADAIDVVDLRALADGGLVREDLYRKVFFLQTAADTPFTNMVATAPCNSDKTEWTFDDYTAIGVGNVRVAGSNPTTFRTATGTRVSARSQINSQSVIVSSTARATATAGNTDQLAYETNKAMIDLRQQVEYNALSHQAAVVGDNNTTAQKCGGFSAWVATNDALGVGGSSGGYNSTTHVTDAPTVGVARALSWAYVTAQLLNTYNKRANTRYLMTVPALIDGITAKIVDLTIKVATPQANIDGSKGIEQIGNGYFGGFISTLGQLVMFVPNRNQPSYTGGGTSSNVATAVDVLLIDPDYVEMGYHEGYKVTDLGPTSALNSQRDIAVSWCVMPRREDAHAVVRDIKPSTAVTA